ncbi:unnamed protein product, partial [Rotaria sp. Silwood2]
MASFVCPLCLNNREITTFWKFFRHITLFHQNERGFHITCDLSSSCGMSYRTYSAYKAHIYRHHASELHLMEKKHDNVYIFSEDDDQQQGNNPNNKTSLVVDDEDNGLVQNDNRQHSLLKDNIELDFLQDDQEETNDDTTTLFQTSFNQKKDIITIADIQKTYLLFMLQLREEFFLPKSKINSISSYIATLLHHVQSLIQQNVIIDDSHFDSQISSSIVYKSHKRIVELDEVNIIMNQVCDVVEATTRNEYQFLNY